MPELRDLTVEFVSLVDRAAVRDPTNPTEPQRLLLFKSERGANNNPPEQGGNVSDTELTAALEKAQAERDEAIQRAEKAEKDLKKLAKKDDKAEPINKDELDPRVREALEKAEATAKAAEERIAKAEELAKAERDERITREFIAKAESEFGHVGGDKSEFGKLLKSASEKLSKEEFEALETRLRAAEEQVSKSALFGELGVGGESKRGSTEHDEKLAKAVEDVRKADPKLSDYEAQEKAMRDNPDLARAYLANVR